MNDDYDVEAVVLGPDNAQARAIYWREQQLIPWYGRHTPSHETGPQVRCDAVRIEDLCDEFGVALVKIANRRGEDWWIVAIEPPVSDDGLEVTGDIEYVLETIRREVPAHGWSKHDSAWAVYNRRLRAADRGLN